MDKYIDVIVISREHVYSEGVDVSRKWVKLVVYH